MPTETVWLTLSGADVAAVLDWRTVAQANQNLGEEYGLNYTQSGSGVDLAAANRRDELVLDSIREIRGAIQAAGRFPVSVTTGTIPPSMKRAALVIAAWQLVLSTPSLHATFFSSSELKSAWQKFYDDAIKKVEGLKNGDTIEQPSYPTGTDYLTAVSDTNPPVSPVTWGDMEATDVQYSDGFVTTASGTSIALPVDDMRTW